MLLLMLCTRIQRPLRDFVVMFATHPHPGVDRSFAADEADFDVGGFPVDGDDDNDDFFISFFIVFR